jgi:hypothetical protein
MYWVVGLPVEAMKMMCWVVGFLVEASKAMGWVACLQAVGWEAMGSVVGWQAVAVMATWSVVDLLAQCREDLGWFVDLKVEDRRSRDFLEDSRLAGWEDMALVVDAMVDDWGTCS